MQARRAATLLLPTALALSRAAAGEFGDPIRGLSPDELQRFGDGRAAFETVEDVADGLGPVLNGTSCAACHNVGGTGGGSETVETRFGTMTNGVFDPLVRYMTTDPEPIPRPSASAGVRARFARALVKAANRIAPMED